MVFMLYIECQANHIHYFLLPCGIFVDSKEKKYLLPVRLWHVPTDDHTFFSMSEYLSTINQYCSLKSMIDIPTTQRFPFPFSELRVELSISPNQWHMKIKIDVWEREDVDINNVVWSAPCSVRDISSWLFLCCRLFELKFRSWSLLLILHVGSGIWSPRKV